MKLSIKDKQESYENTTICYICIEKFDNKHVKDKKYCKIRSHCHYTGEYREAAHIICNLKYSELKKIPIAFHNGSNYDYHFIIKELAEEIQEQITCLGEITTIDKNGEEITKQIPYVLQFINSANLWQAHYQISLIIFLKEFIKLNVNTGTMIKNVKLAKLDINIVMVS